MQEVVFKIRSWQSRFWRKIVNGLGWAVKIKFNEKKINQIMLFGYCGYPKDYQNYQAQKMEDSLIQTPEPVQSPFLNDITQCRASLRRLRKKIYKYTATHRENRKPKMSANQDILLLLRQRNLPSFVIQQVTKKRTFDLASIKNVNVTQIASLEEIVKRTQDQENQIRDLFAQHKIRMKMQNTPQLKFDRRTTNCHSVLASSEEDQEMEEQFVDEQWCKSVRVSEFKLIEQDPMEHRLPLGTLFESGGGLEEHEWFKF